MAKLQANSVGELVDILEDLLSDPREVFRAVQDDLYDEGKSIIRSIKSEHPWEDKTGSLTRSHRVKKRGRLEVELSASAPHAKHLYYGTKAHFVAPVKASALSWVQNGQRRYSGGHWVSGVWAGKQRTNRGAMRNHATNSADTRKNAKETRWFEKMWTARKFEAQRKILKTLERKAFNT